MQKPNSSLYLAYSGQLAPLAFATPQPMIRRCGSRRQVKDCSEDEGLQLTSLTVNHLLESSPSSFSLAPSSRVIIDDSHALCLLRSQFTEDFRGVLISSRVSDTWHALSRHLLILGHQYPLTSNR